MAATLIIDGARWSELPTDAENGVDGLTAMGAYVDIDGADEYVWCSYETDTPAGAVQTGIDPGDYESALSSSTGIECELDSADLASAEAFATALAASIATSSAVTSATARVSAEADGSWGIDIDADVLITTGSRSFSSRGAAGMHGGHGWRIPEGSEAAGWADINISRPIANRITAPPSGARIHAVSVLLGETAGTGSTSRPRITYVISTSATSPGSSTEIVFDFGQVPVSETLISQRATIRLTPAQSDALRTAIDGASGSNHWLVLHAQGGCNYAGMPTGASLNGEQIDQGVRVETILGTPDPGVALAAWDPSGELNFGFLIGAALHYVVDPATTFEHEAIWGLLTAYATSPGDFVLPDNVLGQRGLQDGLEGGRVRSVGIGVVAGQMRVAVADNGTHTPDTPVLAGATALWEDTTSGTGEVVMTLPTGAGTIRVPAAGMWVMWKGTGATGRGEAGAGPFGVTGGMDQPSSFVRRFDTGGNRGTNPGERELGLDGGGYGDDTNAFENPIVDTDTNEFGPGNHPWFQVIVATIAALVTNTQTLAPSGARGRWSVGAESIALGAVDQAPAGARGRWSVGAESIALGAIDQAPSGARGRWSVGAESIALGAVSQSPAGARGRWVVGAESVVLGAVTLAPAGARARWVVGSESITLGALTFTPAGARGRWVATGLTPSLGTPPIVLTPAGARGRWIATGLTPSLGNAPIVLTPDGARGRWIASIPTISLGGLTLAPAGARGRWIAGTPTVSAGSIAVAIIDVSALIGDIPTTSLTLRTYGSPSINRFGEVESTGTDAPITVVTHPEAGREVERLKLDRRRATIAIYTDSPLSPADAVRPSSVFHEGRWYEVMRVEDYGAMGAMYISHAQLMDPGAEE